MAGIDEARQLQRAETVYLVEIALLGSGPTLYFSDRVITVGGILYEDYVHELNGVGTELKRLDSGGLNASLLIKFRNDPWRAYTYLSETLAAYPIVGAAVIVSEVMMESDGTPSDASVVFKGLMEEPHDIDLTDFSCRAMSMEFASDNK
jgi:hypothetical protein